MKTGLKVFCYGVLLCLLVPSLRAQDSLQRIYAGRMLDVADGTLRENVLITVAGDRIQSVQAGAAKPFGKDVIDLEGYTLLPGLIDCHTHLTGNWHWDEDDFDVYTLPAASYGILGTINARATLEAGFTTVRDVHSAFYGDVALRDAIEKGWIPGPRMRVSGPGLTITGGHGALGNWLSPQLQFQGNPISVADGPDEVRKETRMHLKYKVDWIKIFATGGFGSFGTIPGAASYTQEEMAVAVEEARKRGVYACAHAHGAEGIKNALRAGVRSIEHGTYLDAECITLFKEKGAFLVMDLLAARYDYVEEYSGDWMASKISESGQEAYTDMTRRFKMAYDGGVKMAFGTDAGVYPHGRNAEQFALMQAAGMSAADAIRSATLTAAELLNMQADLGTLEAGKWADIIAVPGNPLQDLRTLERVAFVMKGGAVVKRPE